MNLVGHGTSGESFTLGSPKSFQVVAEPIEEEPYLRFVPRDDSQEELMPRLVAEAAERVRSGDLGGRVFYSTELREVTWDLAAPSAMSTLLERLGTQTRILGWRRLGGSVLLEFAESDSEDGAQKGQLLAPEAVVSVHVVVPGPRDGYFSSHIAHGVVETICAVCTFALGRPVRLPPMAVRPTTDDERADLTERFRSPEILTLARKGVSLDIFSLAAREGGLQVQQRLRSALLTFDAAVKQDHNAVACILYIAAAESLTTPNAPWRMERLTKRFVEFFDDLMPDAVDEIVAHGNFEEAIGVRRGTRTPRALRRETLTRLYSMRSGPLHEGLGPSYPGFIVDSGRDIRRALFNDFAEAAILRFKDSPRSSLVGNPALEPNAGEADTHTEIFGLVRPLQKAWRSVCALLRVRAASIKQGKRAR